MSFNAASLKLMAAKGLSFDDVIEIAEAMESRSKGAERQSKYRARKRNGDVTGDVTPPPKDINQTPASEPEGSKAKRKSVFVLPDWVPAEPWAAFEAMRKSMRAAFGPDAKRGIVADLDRLRGEGHDPGKVLLKSVKLGWRGVFGGDDTKATRPCQTFASEEERAKHFEETAEFFAGINQADQAEEYRRKAARLRTATASGQPIGATVQKLMSGVTNQLRATG